jgi:acyl carrier protein
VEHESLSSFIRTRLKEITESDYEFRDDEHLNAAGLNSMSIMRLIVDLELHYGIAFDDEELLFENFSTIAEIRSRLLIHMSGRAAKDDPGQCGEEET